jgi:hypothetical protein
MQPGIAVLLNEFTIDRAHITNRHRGPQAFNWALISSLEAARRRFYFSQTLPR